MSLCEALLFCYWCLQLQYVYFSHRLVCVNTVGLLSGIYPFSALNPDCSFVCFWYSPWYLILLVADGTIMYDAYSTPTMWSMVFCILPRSVSVACLQYLPVSCEMDGLWARDLDTCKSISGEAVSIGTLCGQICTVKLMYIWAMLLTSQVCQ